jgi:hypothetical protein
MSGSRSFACSSLVALGTLVWLLSLGLPAISLSGGETYRGVRVLLDGWRAVRLGIPAWCANPTLLAAILLVALKYYRSAIAASGLSLILAASTGAVRWLAARNGTPLPDFEFEPGVLVWVGSTCTVLAGTCCAAWSSKRVPRTAAVVTPPASLRD